jgi:hypothetical protein
VIKIVTPTGVFSLIYLESETEFEQAVVAHADQIFGSRRVYVECKRRVGLDAGNRIIPDGYLIDFSRPRNPQLVVVEIELAAHDLFRHIGVQLLQYSVSFPKAHRSVKQVLHEEITKNVHVQRRCILFAEEAGLRNLDHLLDYIVTEGEFQPLIIIDEATDELQDVLNSLSAEPEVIEFKVFESDDGTRIYQFDPYLSDVEESIHSTTLPQLDPSQHDTVVVPAHEEGFKETFLGESRWHAVRIHASMIRQLKYVAVYRIRPKSAITHLAPIESIQRWGDTGKMVINFAETAQEINPIKLVPNGKVRALQNLRYTSVERLLSARNLDEAF